MLGKVRYRSTVAPSDLASEARFAEQGICVDRPAGAGRVLVRATSPFGAHVCLAPQRRVSGQSGTAALGQEQKLSAAPS